MKRVQQGFTLIELMIVVAIVGILAAIALPAYQDYVVRSKVSEAEATLASCKTSVAEYISTHSNFPANLDQSGCSNQSTQYVNGASANIDNTGFKMSYTTWNTGAKSNECTVTLTAAGYTAGSATVTNWNGSHTGCDAKYVPSTFR